MLKKGLYLRHSQVDYKMRSIKRLTKPNNYILKIGFIIIHCSLCCGELKTSGVLGEFGQSHYFSI